MKIAAKGDRKNAIRAACQPTIDPIIAIKVTSPNPIASISNAQVATIRISQITPPPTARPTSPLINPSQLASCKFQTQVIPSNPTNQIETKIFQKP